MGNNKITFFAVLLLSGIALADPNGGAPKLSVACIMDNGRPNVTNPNLCTATLPKCSELLNGTQGKRGLIGIIKDQATWKLYGFRRHKDLDLNASKIQNGSLDGLVGPDFNHSVCSVVGPKLQIPGNSKEVPGAEISKQLIGIKGSCGVAPNIEHVGSGVFKINFDAQSGSLWTSYLYGAFPWTVRKNAHKILSRLNADTLSNLAGILSTDQVQVKSGVISLANQMKQLEEVESKLSAAEKQNCSGTNDALKNKCENLKVDDPAARICKLQQARLIMNTGAIANLILLNIMEAAEKDFKKYFTPSTPLGMFYQHKFLNACYNIGKQPYWERAERVLAMACVMGVIDEPRLLNWYCLSGDDHGTQLSKGICRDLNINKQLAAWLRASPKISSLSDLTYEGNYIDFYPGAGMLNRPINSSNRRDATYAVNSGFAGVIEAQIRNYCGQQRITDKNVCDEAGILSIPEGVTD